MSRTIECDSCGTTLRASDRLAGRKVRCPRCRSIIRVASEESEPLDDLELSESVDPPAATLPPRRGATVAVRKKRAPRRSLGMDGPPSVSRYWTLGAGLLLVVATFLMPTPGLFVAIPLGAMSLLAVCVIILMLGVPSMLEHPLLLLQIVLFGGGIGRYTPEQIQRAAARIRRFWPALSHAALAASGCVLAFVAGVNSPSLPPNSPFAIKPRGQQIAQPGQLPLNPAINPGGPAMPVGNAVRAGRADAALPAIGAARPDLEVADDAQAAVPSATAPTPTLPAPHMARPARQWPPTRPIPPGNLPPGVVRRPFSPIDQERFRRLHQRVTGRAAPVQPNPVQPNPAIPTQPGAQSAAAASGL